MNISQRKVIQFFLPSICNLECEYCYLDVLNPKRSNIDIDYQKLLSQVKTHTQGVDKTFIHFIGGEPFMYYKEMVKLLHFFENKTVTQIRLTTNGTLPENINAFFKLVKEEFPELLNKFIINISFDGIKYSRRKGKAYTLENIKNSIEVFKKNEITYFVNIVLNSGVWKHILLDVIENIGTEHNFKLIPDYTSLFKLNDVKEFIENIDLFLDISIADKKSEKDNLILFFISNKKRKEKNIEAKCDVFDNNMVTFLPNGTVTSCEGDIYVKWDKSKYINRDSHVLSKCEECDTKGFCKVCPLAYEEIEKNKSMECYPTHYFTKIHTLWYLTNYYFK